MAGTGTAVLTAPQPGGHRGHESHTGSLAPGCGAMGTGVVFSSFISSNTASVRNPRGAGICGIRRSAWTSSSRHRATLRALLPAAARSTAPTVPTSCSQGCGGSALAVLGGSEHRGVPLRTHLCSFSPGWARRGSRRGWGDAARCRCAEQNRGLHRNSAGVFCRPLSRNKCLFCPFQGFIVLRKYFQSEMHRPCFSSHDSLISLRALLGELCGNPSAP